MVCEALVADTLLLDDEVIALAEKVSADHGLKKVQLAIKTLGDEGDREKYSQQLSKYLKANEKSLTSESRATLERNPLRVLDSKREPDQKVIEAAPVIRDSISATAGAHFETVLQALDACNIKYEINNRLVRGLDYYRRTKFEFTSTALEPAPTAIGWGGPYDGLVEGLGGPA